MKNVESFNRRYRIIGWINIEYTITVFFEKFYYSNTQIINKKMYEIGVKEISVIYFWKYILIFYSGRQNFILANMALERPYLWLRIMHPTCVGAGMI